MPEWVEVPQQRSQAIVWLFGNHLKEISQNKDLSPMERAKIAEERHGAETAAAAQVASMIIAQQWNRVSAALPSIDPVETLAKLFQIAFYSGIAYADLEYEG